MEEILKYDTSFSEAKFKTYVNNVFVQTRLALMSGNLERVKHFLNDSIYEKYNEELKRLQDENVIKMYDELNCFDVTIKDVKVTEDKLIIKVSLISRALEYKINKITRKYVSGNNSSRIERNNILTFEKKKIRSSQNLGRICPSCGASINVNNNGKCDYCGSIYNLKDYEWILAEESIV